MGSRIHRKWHTLTAEQRRKLRDVINDLQGPNLEFDVFVEVAALLIEDLPGLEVLSESQLTRLINELWRDYHGKGKGKK